MIDTNHLTTLISAEAIANRVAELGATIARDYVERDVTPHAVCVLKGGCLFLSDLIRAIPLPLTIDFIAVASYGEGTSTSGEVRLTKDLDQSLQDRDVLIVEDIIDTGLTLSFLMDSFIRRGARTVRVCALLDKKARRRVEIEIDYIGFEIPDEFVVGYGLDHAERYRNLPFIGVPKDPSKL